MTTNLRRVRAAILLSALAVALVAICASNANAADPYYWYTPFGTYDLFAQRSEPGNQGYVSKIVGPSYVRNNIFQNDGDMTKILGYDALNGPATDVCLSYKLPTLGGYGQQTLGSYTGYNVPSPWQEYTVQANSGGAPRSGCQGAATSSGTGWGAVTNASQAQTGCGNSCGMGHVVEFGSKSLYPWSSVFGGAPSLVLKDQFEMASYQESGTSGTKRNYAYTCAVLEDTKVGRANPGWIELCLTKWTRGLGPSQSNSAYPGYYGNCADYNDLAGHGPIVSFFLYGNSSFIHNQGASTNGGALGYYQDFQFAVTKGDIASMATNINARPDGCGHAFSTNAADYRLVALEDVIEMGGAMKLLGGSSTLLQAWTAY